MKNISLLDNLKCITKQILSAGTTFPDGYYNMDQERMVQDWMPLLASRYLPSGAKGRLYSVGVRSAALHGSETWPIQEEDVIRLERNVARMVRLICNVRPNTISAEELWTRLKLKSMRKCLQSGRLQWFVNLETMEESVWFSKCRNL